MRLGFTVRGVPGAGLAMFRFVGCRHDHRPWIVWVGEVACGARNFWARALRGGSVRSMSWDAREARVPWGGGALGRPWPEPDLVLAVARLGLAGARLDLGWSQTCPGPALAGAGLGRGHSRTWPAGLGLGQSRIWPWVRARFPLSVPVFPGVQVLRVLQVWVFWIQQASLLHVFRVHAFQVSKSSGVSGDPAFRAPRGVF